MIILEGIRPVDGLIDYSTLPVDKNSKVVAKYNHDGTFTVMLYKERYGK